jgi:RNA polymerase sigma factor (sigma-70 family)
MGMEQRPQPQGGAEPLETGRAHVLIEAFVRQHSQTLLTIAARLVGREDAEDVAQNAFVNLTVLITRMPYADAVQLLESRENLLRLMCKIASRRAYDRLRERCRNREQLTNGAEIEDVVDEAPRQDHQSPEQELEDNLARLTRAYAELKPMQRIVHVLHYYYHLKHAEIAKMLHISESNSKSLASRAHLVLTRAMEMRQ